MVTPMWSNFNFGFDNLNKYKRFRLTTFTLFSYLGYFSAFKKFSSGFKFIRKSSCIHFCRCEVYHSKTDSLDLDKFHPTSSFITLHIKRAYLQIYFWYDRAFTEFVEIKPEDFGYSRNNNEQSIRQITNNFSIPESFAKPCSSLKCTRKTFDDAENCLLCVISIANVNDR